MTLAAGKRDVRLNIRLTAELRAIIERAAAELGQTVSDFATSTLLREAHEVIQKSQQTRLSKRDGELFLKALEAVDVEPSQALKSAAKKYRRRLG